MRSQDSIWNESDFAAADCNPSKHHKEQPVPH